METKMANWVPSWHTMQAPWLDRTSSIWQKTQGKGFCLRDMLQQPTGFWLAEKQDGALWDMAWHGRGHRTCSHNRITNTLGNRPGLLQMMREDCLLASLHGRFTEHFQLFRTDRVQLCAIIRDCRNSRLATDC